MPIKFLKDDNQSNEKNRISKVRTIIQDDGRSAAVSCEVVSQREYDYIFIYDITEEEFMDGIQLADLTASGRVPFIAKISSPHDYSVTISRKGTRCLAFLGRYDISEKAYYLLDQTQDNVTELLKIQPVIQCQIRYSPVRGGILGLKPSKDQRAYVTIGGDMPAHETTLIYRCEGAGRENVLFGIELPRFWNKELQIVIRKTERIKFLPSTDQSYRLQA